MEEFNVIKTLGNNMHNIRVKKGISLQELADRVDIDTKRLERFEAGENSGIMVTDYVKIADAMGVGFDEFTNGIKFLED